MYHPENTEGRNYLDEVLAEGNAENPFHTCGTAKRWEVFGRWR
jgi:hypothetical protein